MLPILLAVICFIIVLYIRKRHQYFEEHHIPHAPGYFPLGSSIVWKCFSAQQSLLKVGDDLFDQFPNTKAFGYFKPLGAPVLVIKDIDLAKKIMIKHFDHFVDRNFLNLNPKANFHPSMWLVNLKGEKWRANRNLLTPMFTSSKLKAIMPLMHQAGKKLTTYLGSMENVDCKDVFHRFSAEVLGNLGCGVEPNVLKNGYNVFYDQVHLQHCTLYSTLF